MIELLETLNRFDNVLSQTAPNIANRLQAGLTAAEIETQIASFSWRLPQDGRILYQWHNGLSSQPRLNWAEKLLRIKDKWHGELSGRENEIYLKLGDRLIIAKFLPLDYALAGHRHLKLGRCLIDLLPFSILSNGNSTIYCMMRLDPEQPIIYCAIGTNLPPMKITESFLLTQLQFSRLSDLITFLTECFQEGIQPILANQDLNESDFQLNPAQFERLYQQQKS